jgi:hypothetical protein
MNDRKQMDERKPQMRAEPFEDFEAQGLDLGN